MTLQPAVETKRTLDEQSLANFAPPGGHVEARLRIHAPLTCTSMAFIPVKEARSEQIGRSRHCVEDAGSRTSERDIPWQDRTKDVGRMRHTGREVHLGQHTALLA